jgi:hypothetical protein
MKLSTKPTTIVPNFDMAWKHSSPMFCSPLLLAYRNRPCLSSTISYRRGPKRFCFSYRYPVCCNKESPRIQVGDVVVVALPFGKYKVAKVTGFDYSGRTADVTYLEEKQDGCFSLQDGTKSFENVADLAPLTSARYDTAKACYEISQSEIHRVLSAKGPVATAVVSNPPSYLFQVPKPTKRQALYGASISFGMSLLLNLLFTQIRSNEYIHSQW